MTASPPSEAPPRPPAPDPRRGVPALSFDRLTPLYDALVGAAGFGAPLARRVLAASAMADGETLLDVGAGTASLLVLAKRRFARSRVVGVEPDAAILARARAKVGRAGLAVELLHAGAEALPLPDASVDLVTSSLVFHHLPTPAKREAVAEVARVLKPNGRFLLADFGPPDTALLRAAFALVRVLRLPEAPTLQDNVAGRLPRFLAAAGFAVREVASRYRGVHFLLGTKVREG